MGTAAFTVRQKAQRARANGFSLVELLVALFVLALLASVAVLSLPGGGTELRRTAESFAAKAGAARDEAIVTARPVSVVFGPAGYYFETRDEGGWRTPDGRGLEGGDWPDGTEVAGAGEGNRRLVFDSLGLASEDVTVTLSREGQSASVTIARNGDITTTGSGSGTP